MSIVYLKRQTPEEVETTMPLPEQTDSNDNSETVTPKAQEKISQIYLIKKVTSTKAGGFFVC